jgi:PAT family beta-lactamase induction signal transducer AmpG
MSLSDTGKIEAEHASRQARVPPVWILSFPWLTWGMMGGFIVVTLPQMLVAQSVPGDRAAISVAIIFTPMFWGVVFSPLLDVRFRRRTYALVFGVASVIAATVTVRYHPVLLEVEIVMLIGFLCCCLFQAAMGGWAGSLIGKGDDSLLGAWSGMYSVGGSGVGVLISDYATKNFSPTTAAALIFAAFLAPLVVFPLIPAPPPARVPATASFSRFAREVFSLPKKREVLVAMALFALPSSSFALTNALGAWSDSFHAAPSLVSFISGVGIILGSIAGCAVVPPLARRVALRPLYLAIGLVGAAFTIGLLFAPHVSWTFGLAFMGENFFQSAAAATALAIIFEVIGPGNPLAATTFAVLGATMALPIDYMEFVDARGYHWRGITGAFLADALVSGSACVLLAIALRRKLFAVPAALSR